LRRCGRRLGTRPGAPRALAGWVAAAVVAGAAGMLPLMWDHPRPGAGGPAAPGRHGVEVVGAALVAYAGGAGHRSIAARAGLARSTVRNWLRGFAGQVEVLRSVGTRRYYDLDALAAPIEPAGTPAADALEALARAAWATILAHGAYDRPWPVINFLAGGGLLRPGFVTVI